MTSPTSPTTSAPSPASAPPTTPPPNAAGPTTSPSTEYQLTSHAAKKRLLVPAHLRQPGALSLSLVSKHNMTFRKWAVRFVLFAGGLVLSLVLLTFLAVQIQQRTLRWRAERL